jgi:hypothetical protein
MKTDVGTPESDALPRAFWSAAMHGLRRFVDGAAPVANRRMSRVSAARVASRDRLQALADA